MPPPRRPRTWGCTRRGGVGPWPGAGGPAMRGDRRDRGRDRGWAGAPGWRPPQLRHLVSGRADLGRAWHDRGAGRRRRARVRRLRAGPRVLAEEAKHARRTIPVATYAALGMIAVLYAGVSWAMAARAGDGHVVAAAGAQGPGLLFGLGGSGVLSQAAQWLFLTSLFAAALA